MKLRDKIRIRFPRLFHWLIFANNAILPARFFRKSYAQFGEDLIISHLFENKSNGFFVDVGAYRPIQCSNTYFFYKKGWRGINMDAMPGSMKLFKAVRPGDTNLEAAISDKKQKLTYYIFNRPLQNGFYANDLSIPKNEDLKVIQRKEITTCTLEEILNRILQEGQKIDFFSIDVEGLDLAVLKSNNWEKYKPKVILIEILEFKLEKLQDYEIWKYLNQLGYTFYSRTVHTVIFVQKTIH